MSFRLPISLIVIALGVVAGCKAEKSSKPPVATELKVPLWRYSTKSESARKHVEEGERLADQGYPLRANDEFKRAVAADSSFGYAYLRVGENGVSVDETAINVARAKARISSATPVEALLINSAVKRDEGDLEGATELAKQLTGLEPKNPRAWNNLAAQYQNMYKFDSSRAAYQKAIDVDSTYALSAILLSNALTFNDPRDYVKAEQLAQSALRLWPNQPIAHNQLGQLRRMQGRLDEAVAAYTKQLSFDSSDVFVWQVRGNAKLFMGKYDAARADQKEAIRRARPAEIADAASQLAFVSAYAGNIDSTLSDLRTLAVAIPGMHTPAPDQELLFVTTSEFGIALLNQRLDIARSALADATVALRRLSDKAGSAGVKRLNESIIALGQGNVAAAEGKPDEAKARAADIVRIREPDHDPTKFLLVHSLLGQNALMQKDYTTAIRELEQADPSHTGMITLYWLGLAYEGVGNLAAARTEFQRIVDYHFNNYENAAVHFLAVQKLRTLK